MKVLYCNPIFSDYRIPFYKKLNEMFHGKFFVLYGKNRYQTYFEKTLYRIEKELSGIAFGFDGDHVFNTALMKFDVVGGNPKHYIPLTIGLLSRIRKIRPTILITEGFFQWTPWVIFYAFFHRVPVYMGYERTCYTERNISCILKWHRKITDKFITGYLVNGTETKKYLLSLGIKREKIHICGMNADGAGLRQSIAQMNGSDLNDLKKRLKRGEGGIVYLFTGCLIERKGIKYLLSAWKKHVKKYPNDSLVVVGDGELYEECVSLYVNYQSVFFEGRVDYLQIHKYYAVADVYIMPTIEDNWSLVIPEAMSCGLPVATSIYNGCHTDLIKDGVNGFVFDTFDQKSLIETLDKFHHVDLKEFGKKSIEFEKKFDTAHCAQRLYNAIKEPLQKANDE
jgi:glycosyltransferase involved in cell wall biosynthesis